MKGKTVLGVAAGRFHTVLWIKDAVYTVGLNGGPLGYLQDPNGEKFVSCPRQVSALHHKDINITLVSASDGATVCVSERGDIYLLSEYQCKKLASKQLNLKKVLVSGGFLEHKAAPEHLKENGGQPASVFALDQAGRVFCWKSPGSSLKQCWWVYGRLLFMSEVALNKNEIMFVTQDGKDLLESGCWKRKRKVPRLVEGLRGHPCTQVAGAKDHTVVLTEDGYVYTFGLNTFHQLGIQPPPPNSNVPRQIQAKTMKGKTVLGVAAGRFHTVLWIKDAVYTVGLNGGPLVYLQDPNGEKFVSCPRQVSALHHKDINITLVSASDGATVCVSERGDIYLLSEYQCKKLASKQLTLKKVLVSGGFLEHKAAPPEHLKENGGQPASVFALDQAGRVFCWKSPGSSLKQCWWVYGRQLFMSDVALNKNEIMFVTQDGKDLLESGCWKRKRKVPRLVEGLRGHPCTQVAGAKDHTVVLTEDGYVYTFGLNTFHQLGIQPPPPNSNVPRQIQAKTMKGKTVLGVAAGRFHTVLWTKDAVYTVGLNGGQLGYLQDPNGEKFVSCPRQVSALHHKDINITLVSARDGATVCVSERGDIYLLSEYQCKKLASKQLNLKKVLVSGGFLEHKAAPEHLKENGGQPASVFALDQAGRVFCWKSPGSSLKQCWWVYGRQLFMSDVALNKNEIMFVTQDGEGFTGKWMLEKKKKDIFAIMEI
ncbi:uncharacterized protein LOC108705643 [Xenopus laevis]|uniref:Uncharacterized protein LOC108705643 n=1 Tax=Xenopus laevis TaxID=8355 RepID=A0A8J1KS02_XENLA|nr:uncharacterized protein LOC108705643 [Xenopus laevis]